MNQLTDQQHQALEKNLTTALETHTGESVTPLELIAAAPSIDPDLYLIKIRIPIQTLAHLIIPRESTYIGAPIERSKKPSI